MSKIGSYSQELSGTRRESTGPLGALFQQAFEQTAALPEYQAYAAAIKKLDQMQTNHSNPSHPAWDVDAHSQSIQEEREKGGIEQLAAKLYARLTQEGIAVGHVEAVMQGLTSQAHIEAQETSRRL